MEWINFENKAPEDKQRVLFTTNAVNALVDIAIYLKKYSTEKTQADNVFVTETNGLCGIGSSLEYYWMPLPAKP